MLDERLLQLIGGKDRLRDAAALGGGCIAPVLRLTLRDGHKLVAKRTPHAAIEARMLRGLAAAGAPVPAVVATAGDWLVLSDLGGAPGLADDAAARAAGRALARLHAHMGDAYGLAYDVVIGPLPQDNRPQADWCTFYGRRRLVAMAEEAAAAGRLPQEILTRIVRLAERLDRHLPASPPASLLHGDFWHGNILTRPGALCGFIDPAIWHGDPGVDLAMLDLFGALTPAFLDGYREGGGEAAAARDRELMALYRLWPLLVHVRLFGGGYLSQVVRILERFGV